MGEPLAPFSLATAKEAASSCLPWSPLMHDVSAATSRPAVAPQVFQLVSTALTSLFWHKVIWKPFSGDCAAAQS